MRMRSFSDAAPRVLEIHGTFASLRMTIVNGVVDGHRRSVSVPSIHTRAAVATSLG